MRAKVRKLRSYYRYEYAGKRLVSGFASGKCFEAAKESNVFYAEAFWILLPDCLQEVTEAGGSEK
jgi:hypothetical protein